mgnify:CR=1 FL=1
MRPLKIAAAVLCWLLIILAILFTVLDIQLSPESGAQQRFLRFYSEYGTEERFGIEPKQCAAALMAMIQYMRGYRDSIQITVSEYGSAVEMFNRQEIDHMVDVKSLYQSFRKSQLAAIAAFVMGRSSITLRSLAVAVIIFFIILGVLGIWAYTDFTAFWTAFHHLFFTNDLWLMDPAVCRMIRICPESLFAGMAGSMAAWSAGLILAASLLLAAIEKALAKKHKAK